VRSQPHEPYSLDENGLLEALCEQNWASAPYDVFTKVGAGFVLVAGTFEMTPKGHVVREYFVTDGVSPANAAMPGRCDAIAGVVRSADRLVSTLQFETVSCALDPQGSSSTSRSATS
jgi:hypothetical protein